MKKGIIVAVATLAMGLMGLFATPAKALQYGFNAGYTSVGFQLHGMGGEFLLGLQEKDGHRPQGSVLRIGLAGAWGMGSTDLNKAIWNGESYDDFLGTSAVNNARAQTRARIISAGGEEAFNALSAEMQQAGIDQSIGISNYPGGYPGGLTAFLALSEAERQDIAATAIEAIRTQGGVLVKTGVERGLASYGITDLADAKGDATAFFVSAAYEYVLAKGAPGLGFIVGGELYVSQGGYKSLDSTLPNVSTEGGIGGGGVVGISYYLKNGLNFTVKTGLGVVDPGKVKYSFLGDSVTVEPETAFYASPTFALGYIY